MKPKPHTPTPFAHHRALFARKPLLRRIYTEDFFPRLRSHCRSGGPTVEIGSGPGLLKDAWPKIIATDVTAHSGMDAALDACRLPFRSRSLENIVGLDVLHHLPDPLAFLSEAERALRPGGRMVFIEPWLTFFSRIIYRHFHREDCDETVDPFAKNPLEPGGADPMRGNQALPFLLFGPGMGRTLARISSFQLIVLEKFCGAAYLLSLGFRPGSLAPGWSYPWLRSVEAATGSWWKSWGAMRALIVLAKRP